MISETKAIKIVVKKFRRKPLRDTAMRPQGRSKVLSHFSRGRSINLGWEAIRIIATNERFQWGSRSMSRRLAKRIGKKLGQPFRRKKRGPLHRKAAGKNNVRPVARY